MCLPVAPLPSLPSLLPMARPTMWIFTFLNVTVFVLAWTLKLRHMTPPSLRRSTSLLYAASSICLEGWIILVIGVVVPWSQAWDEWDTQQVISSSFTCYNQVLQPMYLLGHEIVILLGAAGLVCFIASFVFSFLAARCFMRWQAMQRSYVP